MITRIAALMPDKKFIAFHILAFLAIISATFIMPGAPVWQIIVSSATSWTIAMWTYSRSPFCSRCGALVLTIAWTLLNIGVVANIWYFTTVQGGTISNPVQLNPDSFYYFALNCADKMLALGTYSPYLWLHCIVIWIFGHNILAVITINVIATLLTVVTTGYLSGLLAVDRNNRASTLGMAMVASVSYLMAVGTVALKEPFCILGLTLVATAMACINIKGSKPTFFTIFTIGTALMASTRIYFLAVIAVGVLFCFHLNRANARVIKRCLTIVLVVWGIYLLICLIDLNRPPISTAIDKRVESYVFYHSYHERYDTFAEKYILWPAWMRLLFLPISAGVQFLIPLFWNASSSLDFGPAMAYAHFGIPWYIVGTLTLYFILFKARKATFSISRLTLWAAAAWLLPAFTFAGLVSRYGLSCIPVMIPAATMVIMKYRGERNFRIFASTFGILIILALIAAYIFQHS